MDKRKGKLNSRKKMFFKKCNIIHNGKYSYNESTFKNQNSIIEIICPNHGEFTQKANSHILGSGCIKCSGVELKSTDLFIIQASENHNNYYDYSKVEYKGSHSYIEIICPNHGEFTQKAYSHLNMLQGCPKCKSSKGEKIARMYFEKNNINYIEQYTFDGCYYKDKLRFDFYLPDMDICVEYDGLQHFESVRKFGGKKKFELQKIKDEIKNKYCFNNNMKMIRIPYYENVFEFLDKEFNLKTKKIKEFFTPFQRTIFHITEFMENKSEYKFSDMIREIDHHYKSDGNANSSLRKFFKKIPKYKLEKRNNNTYILNI